MIYTQNATSTVTINTSTGTSGSVSTHVETNVNGHIQNFDTTQPGNYHIENNGTTSSVTSSSPSAIPTPTVTQKPHSHTSSAESLLNKMKNWIHTFFANFFHISLDKEH